MFRKKIVYILIILFAVSAFLWAGDTAVFVDLGFSPDGRNYAFAQYGVQSGTLRPWADLFVVDVSQNNFVPGGRLNYTHDIPVSSGQDGSGALNRVISVNTSLTDRYGVNFLSQGKPLYISLDEAPPSEAIEFRDFETGASYRATLVSSTEGTETALKSSFHINLERTGKNGERKTYTAGSPQVKRDLIVSYRIRKVLASPNGGNLILVIEMKKQDGADYDIRYMIEALRL